MPEIKKQAKKDIGSVVKNIAAEHGTISQKPAFGELRMSIKASPDKISPTLPKKKIMIAWSSGGGCHLSMFKALEAFLGSIYDIVGFEPISDVLYPLDPVYKITWHAYRGEDFYNYLLSNDMPWLVNKLVSFGSRGIKRQHKRTVAFLEKYLRAEKPAAVISVIPLLNSALAEACKNLQIPFLVVILDNIKNFFLFELPEDSDHISCTIPVNNKSWREDAKVAGIDSKLIKATGFPVRPDFFEPKDKVAIRASFAIPENKPVVMLLMGGAGSSRLIKYVKRMAKFSDPMHILACVGRSAETGEKIKKIKMPKHITISVIGQTTRISDLMAISDVLITKTGPSTIFEAIEMQLPIIADGTSTVLDCERPYIDTIKKLGLGKVLTGFGEFREILHNLLTDQKQRARIRRAMSALSNRDYPEKIKKIIAEMLSRPVSPVETVIAAAPRRRVGIKRGQADTKSAN